MEGSTADLFTTQPDPVVLELLGLDINRLTPIEALTKLYEFQEKAGEGDAIEQDS